MREHNGVTAKSVEQLLGLFGAGPPRHYSLPIHHASVANLQPGISSPGRVDRLSCAVPDSREGWDVERKVADPLCENVSQEGRDAVVRIGLLARVAVQQAGWVGNPYAEDNPRGGQLQPAQRMVDNTVKVALILKILGY